jgi:truncated hemoglobin YjbI
MLVRSVGGLPALRRFTTIFYQRCFADPHVDKFLRRHDDPHGERFACWIAEKFGDGTPWTEERMTRPQDVMAIRGFVEEVAFDRSSAHFAAWNSPKREPHKIGQHFKPDDARVWMRLHFWAAREAGFFEPQHAAFMDYYTRFIGHFISIYSSKAPPFTRESARWSADPQNIERYLASGNLMSDVIDKPVEQALRELPASELVYTGSASHRPSWPYEMSPLH